MSHALDATYCRTALLLGLVTGQDIHRWAELVIEREREPPKEFFEIVSAPVGDLSALRHALWPLVIEPEPASVIDAILGTLYADLVGERRSLEDTLTILRQMRSLLRLPAEIYAHLNDMLVRYAASHQPQVIAEWLHQFAESKIELGT